MTETWLLLVIVYLFTNTFLTTLSLSFSLCVESSSDGSSSDTGDDDSHKPASFHGPVAPKVS